jgi:transcriptional regulator of heat shock response
MKNRESTIFKTLVSEHIKTAEPISSQTILHKSNLQISSATVRNIMVELETLGLIFQPHTSAGRIPTSKGYQEYIDNHLSDTKLTKKDHNDLEIILNGLNNNLREFAKCLAEISNLLVFIAFGKSDIFYTGLSNLMSQPEFSEYKMVCDISKTIDNLDNVIYKIFEDVNNEIEIFIGDHNPFGQDCSTLLSQFSHNKNQGILGLIGPMRMDYETNIALLNFTKNYVR